MCAAQILATFLIVIRVLAAESVPGHAEEEINGQSDTLKSLS